MTFAPRGPLLRRCLWFFAPVLGALLSPISSGATFQASDWRANVWGGPTFIAESASQCAREGVKGYYFQIDKRGAGDAEVTLPGVLQSGKAYQLSVWLKAGKGMPTVDVFFRRDEAHYETTAIRTVVTKNDWSLVQLRGIYTQASAGSVRLAVRQPGLAVCVSGAHLDEIEPHSVGIGEHTEPVAARFFGTHLNQLGRHSGWPNFNPGMIRLWDSGTTWADLQPTKGPINWAGPRGQRLDLFVRHVRRHNPQGNILMTLGMTPEWAGSPHPKRCNNSGYGPGICTAPKDMDDWRAYVRAVATRYKGQIRYWEIWNEADIWVHWDDSPLKMLELVKVAYQELKAVDPSNFVIGPNVTENGMRFLNDFLVAGGGKYIDAISIHAYFARAPDTALGNLRNVRALLSNYDLRLSIWNTETSVGCSATDTKCRSQSADVLPADVSLAQSLIGSAALGIENSGYYTWEGAGAEGLVEADFTTQTAQGVAVARVRRWLDGAKVSYLPNPSGGVNLIQIERRGSKAYVIWADRNGVSLDRSVVAGANRYQTLRQRSDKTIVGNLDIGVEPSIYFGEDFAFEDRWAQ